MSSRTPKAVILNAEGELLAAATPWIGDDGFTVALSHLTGKDALLAYFFGRGGRGVRVVVGEVALVGTLRTCWQESRRIWMIRLTAAAPWGVLAVPKSGPTALANANDLPRVPAQA